MLGCQTKLWARSTYPNRPNRLDRASEIDTHKSIGGLLHENQPTWLLSTIESHHSSLVQAFFLGQIWVDLARSSWDLDRSSEILPNLANFGLISLLRLQSTTDCYPKRLDLPDLTPFSGWWRVQILGTQSDRV